MWGIIGLIISYLVIIIKKIPNDSHNGLMFQISQCTVLPGSKAGVVAGSLLKVSSSIGASQSVRQFLVRNRQRPTEYQEDERVGSLNSGYRNHSGAT